MMDEAGAFWSSIANIQGEEDFQRSVSCKKHFDFTALRQEKTLVGGEVKSEFKFLCNSLQKAETPLLFQKASERMDEFIKTQSSEVMVDLNAKETRPCFPRFQASPQCS